MAYSFENTSLIGMSTADLILILTGGFAMSGPRQKAQAALFDDLSLEDHVHPGHSTSFKNRHGCFRDSVLRRHLCEGTAARCITKRSEQIDVEATCAIRQAEVGTTKAMLNRVKDKFDLQPERLIADTAYGPVDEAQDSTTYPGH